MDFLESAHHDGKGQHIRHGACKVWALNIELVAVIPGTAFGRYGEGYIRCSYAAPMPDIEEALVRMRRFVEKHK